MTTAENLKEAFAAESQVNRRYLAFARRAEQEGLGQVARLFRAVAAAETVHALAHFKAMRGIKSTAENLQEAIKEESMEANEVYPQFVAIAMDEGEKLAMLSFNNAMETEKVHHRLYVEALNKVRAGQDLPQRDITVCGRCGYTVVNEPPDRCPICGAAKEDFHNVP